MKQAVNFRLSLQAIHTLSLLEKKFHTTKTAIVEVALQVYAKKNLPVKNTLLTYAGILEKNEAENILSHIKKSRLNKNKDILL